MKIDIHFSDLKAQKYRNQWHVSKTMALIQFLWPLWTTYIENVFIINDAINQWDEIFIWYHWCPRSWERKFNGEGWKAKDELGIIDWKKTPKEAMKIKWMEIKWWIVWRRIVFTWIACWMPGSGTWKWAPCKGDCCPEVKWKQTLLLTNMSQGTRSTLDPTGLHWDVQCWTIETGWLDSLTLAHLAFWVSLIKRAYSFLS